MDEVALRVPSRAFATQPPMVRNRGLVPAAVLDAMSFAWNSRAHPARDVVLRRVRDAYVLGEGLVLDRSLAVIPASVTQHSPAEVDAAAARLQAAVAAGGIPTLPGTTLLCAKRGAANYGHWQPVGLSAMRRLPIERGHSFACLPPWTSRA